MESTSRRTYRLLLSLGLGVLAASLTGQNPGYAREIREHRQSYRQAFVQNPASPLNEREVRQLRFYKPNPAFCVTARVERPTQSAPFLLATSSGDTQEFIIYAYAIFNIKGYTDTLAVLRSTTLSRVPQYRDLLFIPFCDDTNGNTTYGGGRYLDCHIRDIQNDQLTLDFNLAYNPYCAYKSAFSCPIPPAQNTLSVSVQAGEKRPRQHAF